MVKHEDTTIVFSIPLCDYGNQMLNDKTHVRSRNENILRDRVITESDENNFFHKSMLCNIFTFYTGGSQLSHTAVKPDSRLAQIFFPKFVFHFPV